MVNVNIEIPDEIHKRLKVAAVLDDTTIKALVTDILAETTKQAPARAAKETAKEGSR